MKSSSKEPIYQYSEQEVANRSPLAKSFLETRARLNKHVDVANNKLLKRFYNIDHNTYLEGEVPSKYKELMGLSVSAALRCDDCINYHVIQAFRLGASKKEIEETLDISVVVAGSIVIPHLRRAYELTNELYGVNIEPN